MDWWKLRPDSRANVWVRTLADVGLGRWVSRGVGSRDCIWSKVWVRDKASVRAKLG